MAYDLEVVISHLSFIMGYIPCIDDGFELQSLVITTYALWLMTFDHDQWLIIYQVPSIMYDVSFRIDYISIMNYW